MPNVEERSLQEQGNQTTASERKRYMICLSFSTPDLAIFEGSSQQLVAADSEIPRGGTSVTHIRPRPGKLLGIKGVPLDTVSELIQSVEASRRISYGAIRSLARSSLQEEALVQRTKKGEE